MPLGTALGLALACRPPTPLATGESEPAPGSQPQAASDALYFLMVDRFHDGSDTGHLTAPTDPQGWHGGDLRGVLDQLDYIEGLGVGGIWLTPLSASRQEKVGEWGAFHGYWVNDLAELEPRMGTWEDARALSDALEARGMSLVLDLVLNHTDYEAPLRAAHPNWYHGNGDITDWDDPNQVVTHDVHGLPDLAQEKPEVHAYLRDAAEVWMEAMSPDAFRIDAVRHLPPGFLATLRGELEIPFYGEVFEGDPDALAARQKEDALDAVFDFPLHYAMKDVFCGGDHPGRVASMLPADGARITFLDNHDVPRIVSACNGNVDQVEEALLFWLTARGRPCITWGTEIGLAGAEEPENRADMQFGVSHRLGERLRTLLGLRARYPVLQSGIDEVITLTADQLVYLRHGRTHTAVIAVGSVPDLPDLPVVTSVSAGRVSVSILEGTRLRPEGTVTVTVTPTGVPEGEGELVLVGAGAALGAWNPEAGVRSPYALEVAAGQVLAMKWVRVGAEPVWSPGPNRYVQAKEGTVAVSW